MRVLAALTVVAGVLAAASPAAADWQWTKWGMSPSEVIAASGGKAQANSGETALMPGPILAGGMSFDRATFVFTGGALSGVTLVSEKTQFYEAEWKLSAVYGQPVAVQNGTTPTRVYVDKARGNMVRLSSVYGVVVAYAPIPTGL